MVIQKAGAAQVLVIGLPNAGKSQLVNSLTNASPTVAEYPFTTSTATPGMMEFENIQIQLIDTPPLVPNSTQLWLPPNLIRADALSTHGIGLAEVIGMLNILKIEVELRIIGIQAKEVTFGEGLSPEVSSKIETILELVKEEIK